jgi:hypothetical protein
VAVTFSVTVTFSAWHPFAEGLRLDVPGAFLVLVLYASISATCVVVGSGLFGNSLRVIRAERTQASNHTPDVR